LDPDQFIVAWSKGKEKLFIIRLDLNLKTVSRIFVLNLKRTDRWLVYPTAFARQNRQHASDCQIRLAASNLRLCWNLMDATLR
jgi:hypothetical protein